MEQEFSISPLAARIATEADAYKLPERLRFADGMPDACPQWGVEISVRTWLFRVLELSASKNGVSARKIERKYNLTLKAAWFMLHRLRETMERGDGAPVLSGTIVADETWIGGSPANQHARTRLTYSAGAV